VINYVKEKGQNLSNLSFESIYPGFVRIFAWRWNAKNSTE